MGFKVIVRGAGLLAAATLAGGFAFAAPASAHTPAPARGPVHYRSCADLNRVYHHGVGLPGARDKVRGHSRPARNFTVNVGVYRANVHLDADRDGIACER